jgi:hypothetical protein
VVVVSLTCFQEVKDTAPLQQVVTALIYMFIIIVTAPCIRA